MSRAMHVAIVGAGPAGSRLAAALARAGHRVSLIDRSFDREKPCGGGVPWEGLERLGAKVGSAHPLNPALEDAGSTRERLWPQDPDRGTLTRRRVREGRPSEEVPGQGASDRAGLGKRSRAATPPAAWIRRVRLEGPAGEIADVALPDPLAVFSRRVLDRSLVENARDAGASLIEDAVKGIASPAASGRSSAYPASDADHAAPRDCHAESDDSVTSPSARSQQTGLSMGSNRPNALSAGLRRSDSDDAACWTLDLASGKMISADFLVGADGARSLVRRTVARPFAHEDLSQAVGWYRQGGTSDTMTIRFDAQIRGYLWIFPRTDHLAIGACGPLAEGGADALWASARRLIQDHGIAERELTPYSALIPTLRAASARENLVAGPGWALVGDASGSVDPLTREGIRHGLHSSDLLAEAMAEGDPQSYGDRWRRAFVTEFAWAAERSERFFAAQLTSRLVRYAGRSSTIRRVLVDLVNGAQDYRSLKRRLVRSAPKVGFELLISRNRGDHAVAENGDRADPGGVP